MRDVQVVEVGQVLEVALAQSHQAQLVASQDESPEVGSGLGPAPRHQADPVPGEVEVLQLSQGGQRRHLPHGVPAQVQPRQELETGETGHGDRQQVVVRQTQGVQHLLQAAESLPVDCGEGASGDDQAGQREVEIVEEFPLQPADVPHRDVQ